jgi:hypothetical protein
MPAIRLIPKTDESDFPYDAALELIRQLPHVDLRPKDFAPLLEAGRRMRWTDKMIRSHEEMAARGKCYEFRWAGPPALLGTLFEDNVFFNVIGDEQATLRFIQAWADKLDVRVFQH